MIEGARAVKIRWLGQAGFLLSWHSNNLLIDPWFAPHPDRLAPPPSLEDLPTDITAVLATHEHGDHLDLATLPTLVSRYPHMRVVVPEPLVDLVRGCVGSRGDVAGIRPGQSFEVGKDCHLLATPAWHGVTVSDGYTDGGWYETGLSRFVGYVVALPGVTVYHAGDTVLAPELITFLRPLAIDVALLPINGRDARREGRGILGNLDSSEAIELAEEVGARILVPMHHDMVRGNDASESSLLRLAVEGSRAPKVWCLERGRSYTLPERRIAT